MHASRTFASLRLADVLQNRIRDSVVMWPFLLTDMKTTLGFVRPLHLAARNADQAIKYVITVH